MCHPYLCCIAWNFIRVRQTYFFLGGGGFDTCVTIQSGFWPCALNGQEALAMLEETHQKDSDYEVILTDWMLPGMDYHTSKPIDVNKVAELLRKYMS